MALVKYNDRSLRNLTTQPAAVTGNSPGALVHIKTLTASSSATVNFVNGASGVVLNSTYPVYKFVCIDIHAATSSAHLTVNFRDGSTAYDATKTTTLFRSQHDEADSATSGPFYKTAQDLAQATGDQILSTEVGNGNDECTSGTLHLYDPSSTTFVKHFMSTFNCYMSFDYSNQDFVSGYCNVTAAIDGVQFKFSSGNMDAGTFKLYGIKDS